MASVHVNLVPPANKSKQFKLQTIETLLSVNLFLERVGSRVDEFSSANSDY